MWPNILKGQAYAEMLPLVPFTKVPKCCTMVWSHSHIFPRTGTWGLLVESFAWAGKNCEGVRSEQDWVPRLGC